MKKIISMLILVAMVLCTAACEKKIPENDSISAVSDKGDSNNTGKNNGVVINDDDKDIEELICGTWLGKDKVELDSKFFAGELEDLEDYLGDTKIDFVYRFIFTFDDGKYDISLYAYDEEEMSDVLRPIIEEFFEDNKDDFNDGVTADDLVNYFIDGRNFMKKSMDSDAKYRLEGNTLYLGSDEFGEVSFSGDDKMTVDCSDETVDILKKQFNLKSDTLTFERD